MPAEAGTPCGQRRVPRALVAGAALVLAALTTAPALAAPAAFTTQRAESGESVHAVAAPRSGQGRGTLLSLTPLGRQSLAEVIGQAQKQGLKTGTARHGVAAYRLTYRTITPDGRPTTASGLLALPTGGDSRHLPPVVHTHGTLAYRGYAPSMADGPDRAVSVLYASAGRAALAPDYLGLGTSPGRHPYMDARSSVSASLDMLRAAHSAAPKLGATLDRTVSVTGFSQGGQVAMALGRELHRGADPRFRLGMLAPVGGPYDLIGAVGWLLGQSWQGPGETSGLYAAPGSASTRGTHTRPLPCRSRSAYRAVVRAVPRATSRTAGAVELFTRARTLGSAGATDG
ncbi:alpha/beta hydrolase family protein [Streptomyces nigrescens]